MLRRFSVRKIFADPGDRSGRLFTANFAPREGAGAKDLHSRGMTLLELLTVLAIISVLVVVALPAYLQYQARSRVAEAAVMFDGKRTSVEEYYMITGNWPSNNAEAGLGPATDYETANIASMSIGNGGTLTITMKRSPLVGQTIVWTPASVSTGIVWDCTEGTVPDTYRPAICR
jgi:type IV pilus assembly protein PilA